MSESRAVVVPVEGDARVIDWPEDDSRQLEVMYEAIGCQYVELVKVTGFKVAMWVDEEGLFVQNPEQNHRASSIARRSIVGTVLLTGLGDGPDTPGFANHAAEELAELLNNNGE